MGQDHYTEIILMGDNINRNLTAPILMLIADPPAYGYFI